jgi:hypothetical protein
MILQEDRCWKSEYIRHCGTTRQIPICLFNASICPYPNNPEMNQMLWSMEVVYEYKPVYEYKQHYETKRPQYRSKQAWGLRIIPVRVAERRQKQTNTTVCVALVITVNKHRKSTSATADCKSWNYFNTGRQAQSVHSQTQPYLPSCSRWKQRHPFFLPSTFYLVPSKRSIRKFNSDHVFLGCWVHAYLKAS